MFETKGMRGGASKGMRGGETSEQQVRTKGTHSSPFTKDFALGTMDRIEPAWVEGLAERRDWHSPQSLLCNRLLVNNMTYI